jgi:hypothetical protein
MPNHCTNHLCITGPKKDRDAFMATLKNKGYCTDHEEGTFCFHQTVPMPESVFRGDLGSKEEALYPGEKNWYGWAIANWGTKWSNYETSPVETTSRSINVEFMTAWSPPDKWLANVSEKFQGLKFSLTYEVEGGCGSGRIVAMAGQLAEMA